MNNTYEFSGQSLTPRMARELILEFFTGQTVHRQEIFRKVEEEHVARGGRLATSINHPGVSALNTLKSRNLANNPNSGDGIWTIYGEPDDEGIDDDTDYDGIRRLGTGNKSVYVYYYPAYKERAELREEDTWPCKVGRTEYANPIHRILGQPGTAMPEKPEIALVIQTDRPRQLENAIHRLLDGNRISDAPGTEWFLTNPSEVEEKYDILSEYHS